MGAFSFFIATNLFTRFFLDRTKTKHEIEQALLWRTFHDAAFTIFASIFTVFIFLFMIHIFNW